LAAYNTNISLTKKNGDGCDQLRLLLDILRLLCCWLSQQKNLLYMTLPVTPIVNPLSTIRSFKSPITTRSVLFVVFAFRGGQEAATRLLVKRRLSYTATMILE
jgi:hypothetical protein